jgi:ABC-2 type transport system permease protein
MAEFNKWLHSQLRVFGTTARKEFLIFTRYPANAVLSLIEPLMWLTPLYFMGKAFSVGGHAVGFEGFAGTSDYFSFVMVGAFMSSYIAVAFWGMAYSIEEDMILGVLEPNWVTPANRVSMLLGRSITFALLTTLQSMGVLLMGALLFDVKISGDIFVALLIIVPMLIAILGLGLGLAGVVLAIRRAQTAIDISNWVVSQISGMQFPVTVLPKPLMAVALLLPTTYGYDAVRSVLLGTSSLLPVKQEIMILVISAVVLCTVGGIVFYAFDGRCRRLGTIGGH